ncbi:hypothetical protein HAX54_030212 [Datura stramonium]|uniref:Uncharacterized protein n=1 Tax=Datura stramonium TaxID=4076 RepID=A0ABS8VA64_DATST|nr:hypothetical protein [Datura stramonium]
MELERVEVGMKLEEREKERKEGLKKELVDLALAQEVSPVHKASVFTQGPGKARKGTLDTLIVSKCLTNCANPQSVSANRGGHRPIMNLHERSLSVLACRYADEVIIGAPWEVSKDMPHAAALSISLLRPHLFALNGGLNLNGSDLRQSSAFVFIKISALIRCE